MSAAFDSGKIRSRPIRADGCAMRHVGYRPAWNRPTLAPLSTPPASITAHIPFESPWDLVSRLSSVGVMNN